MSLENEAATVAATPEAQPVETAPAPQTDSEPKDWGAAFDADLKAIYAKNNPERDDAGKFASRETPQTGQTEIKDQATEKAGEPQQQAAAIPPPDSWSADVKETWASLPPKVQEYVAKRELEIHEKISQQGREISQVAPLIDVVGSYGDVFDRYGIAPDQGVAMLLQAERELASNPQAAIAKLAGAYGVDLSAYGANAAPGTQEYALQQHIATLESRLNETTERLQRWETQEVQSKQQNVLSEIERFAKDKSDWAELENDILTEITGLRAAISSGLLPDMPHNEILSKAYERAQRNNPAVWAKKQETERKAEEAKRVEEAQKRADEAKRGKVVNINSPSVSAKSISTIDDDLRQVYRKAHAR